MYMFRVTRIAYLDLLHPYSPTWRRISIPSYDSENWIKLQKGQGRPGGEIAEVYEPKHSLFLTLFGVVEEKTKFVVTLEKEIRIVDGGNEGCFQVLLSCSVSRPSRL